MGKNSKDNSLGRYNKLVSIRDNYFYCYHRLRGLSNNNYNLSEDKEGSISQYRSYIKRVENVFDKLDHVSKMIINKEFFYNDYRMWWVSVYSRSTFYRLRNRAILLFLEAFN